VYYGAGLTEVSSILIERSGCNDLPVAKLLHLNLTASIMRYCLLLFVCVAFAAGCKSSTAPDGDNTIAGLVVLYDSASPSTTARATALTDFSGVTIVIDGTNHKTISDASGHFQFDHLSNGTYSITATKPGFGTYHWFEQQVVNGRLDLPAALFARMGHDVPVLSKPNGVPAIFELTVMNAVSQTFAFYCDRDSLTPADAPHFATICDGNGYPAIDFSISLLRTAGARTGDTLYFTCSTVFDGAWAQQYYHPEGSSYYDPIRHQTRYSSCGPRSNVVKAVMP
jgi:hypothetical protein